MKEALQSQMEMFGSKYLFPLIDGQISYTYLTNAIQGFFCSSLFAKFSLFKAHPPPLPLLSADDYMKSSLVCQEKTFLLILVKAEPSITFSGIFNH